VGPGRPRLVRICTTPFAASVPYSAAADGPFTISMDSISSGLKSLMREGAWPPVRSSEIELAPLSTRIPSTTMMGSLVSERLLEPRIRIRLPVPVVPPLGSTSTPGTRPLRRLAMSIGNASSAVFAASIVDTALPSSRLSCSPPLAVTTTTSRGTAAVERAKFRDALSPAATVIG
jgi:hypothetical protein